MFGLFKRQASAFENVSGAEFKSLIAEKKDAIILDVRTSGEVRTGKIKGARNIDFLASDFKKHVQQLDPSKTYLLYCRSGARSQQACKVMGTLGFDNLFNLKGGIGSWPDKLD
jgi:rhodanese-related sulfurtransferase